MFVADLLVALAVALLLTALFAAAFGATGPWDGYWIFFIIVLLVAWAAGTWFRPLGPTIWGVAWIPFLLFGIIAALIIAAATPPAPPEERVRYVRRTRSDGRVVETDVEGPVADEEDLVAEDATAAAVGVFFWVLLLILLLAVAVAYFV